MEEDLHTLATKQPYRYQRSVEGQWLCPPGDELTQPLGFSFRVCSSALLPRTYVDNLDFLTNYFISQPVIPERLTTLVREHVAASPGISIGIVVGDIAGLRPHDLYALIAQEQIFAATDPSQGRDQAVGRSVVLFLRAKYRLYWHLERLARACAGCKSRVGEQQLARLEVGEPQEKGSTENCPFSGTVVELQSAQIRATGVEKLLCPGCGAARKATLRGELVIYPPHTPLHIIRALKGSLWIRQGTTWAIR